MGSRKAAKKENEYQQQQYQLQKEMNELNYNEALKQIDDAWDDIYLSYNQDFEKIGTQRENASEEFNLAKTQAERNAAVDRQTATDQFNVAAKSKYNESIQNTQNMTDMSRAAAGEKSTALATAGQSGTRNSGTTKSGLEQKGDLIDEKLQSANDQNDRDLLLYSAEASQYTKQADESLERQHQQIAKAQTEYDNYVGNLDQALAHMEEVKDQKYKQLYGASKDHVSETGENAGAQDLLTHKFNKGQQITDHSIDFLQDIKGWQMRAGFLQDVAMGFSFLDLF